MCRTGREWALFPGVQAGGQSAECGAVGTAAGLMERVRPSLRHRRAVGPPALQRLEHVVQRPVAVGDEGIALLLAAGDQRGKAADAELLRSEEVSEGLVAGIRSAEGIAEFLLVEARLLGNRNNLLGRGHVAVLGVERLGNAGHEGQRHRRLQPQRRDHGPAGGLGVVDERFPLERGEIERLPARGMDAGPGIADVGPVLLAHRRGVAGAQAAHHQLHVHAPLEALGERPDHRREAVAPRAHGIGEVYEAML